MSLSGTQPQCLRGASPSLDLGEIKAEAGVLSHAQRSVAAAVLAAGGHVGVARDAEEALACLDAWGIPRARAWWCVRVGRLEARHIPAMLVGARQLCI